MNNHPNKVWKTMAATLQACVYICLGLWLFLTSTVCSSPKSPNAASGNVIARNCHGTMVYITRTQDSLLTWLIPGLVAAGLGGLAARKRAKRDSTSDKAAGR